MIQTNSANELGPRPVKPWNLRASPLKFSTEKRALLSINPYSRYLQIYVPEMAIELSK